MNKRVHSGSPWEKTFSYCRATRRGNFIAVAGTTSMKDGEVWAAGDAAAQAQRCFEIIEAAVLELGGTRQSILRTRMFVTDIALSEVFGRAHGEFFRDVVPAASMYEVKALIRPELLIEVEADAIVE